MDGKFIKLDIPGGLHMLPTQVAGHTFDLKTMGLLQDASKRYVYKPLGKPECGERELQFYERLQRGAGVGNGEQCTLQRLVPRFHSKLKLVINQREHIFLKLEDLTSGMSLPCIMDVKVGKQTWDPLADEQKRAVEQKKYAKCKQVLGLCVPGFQVYVLPEVADRAPQLLRHGKEFGKSLDAADFRATMAMFLNMHRQPCKALIREVLRQLYDIRDWFSQQVVYHFYASSLLILYDCEQLNHLNDTSINPPPMHYHDDDDDDDDDGAQQALNGNGNGANAQSHHETAHHKQQTAHCAEPIRWVRVRMIDFAHVFPSESGGLDQNYLFGLQNLIAVIESLLG